MVRCGRIKQKPRLQHTDTDTLIHVYAVYEDEIFTLPINRTVVKRTVL